jgi:hypothetical protein
MGALVLWGRMMMAPGSVGRWTLNTQSSLLRGTRPLA